MKMRDQISEIQPSPRLYPLRRNDRKTGGHLNWVQEHLHITTFYSVGRVPLPENGKHVGKRGRKATGQSWALIAGLPKDALFKRRRTCQGSRAH